MEFISFSFFLSFRILYLFFGNPLTQSPNQIKPPKRIIVTYSYSLLFCFHSHILNSIQTNGPRPENGANSRNVTYSVNRYSLIISARFILLETITQTHTQTFTYKHTEQTKERRGKEKNVAHNHK